jgi:hypothetical protein
MASSRHPNQKSGAAHIRTSESITMNSGYCVSPSADRNLLAAKDDLPRGFNWTSRTADLPLPTATAPKNIRKPHFHPRRPVVVASGKSAIGLDPKHNQTLKPL